MARHSISDGNLKEAVETLLKAEAIFVANQAIFQANFMT